MEEGNIYIERQKYLFISDIVDEMLKGLIEDLISVTICQKRSYENISETRVQKWVKKLRKFREDDDLLEFIGPVSLEWMMFRAITELEKEIDKYFDEK